MNEEVHHVSKETQQEEDKSDPSSPVHDVDTFATWRPFLRLKTLRTRTQIESND